MKTMTTTTTKIEKEEEEENDQKRSCSSSSLSSFSSVHRLQSAQGRSQVRQIEAPQIQIGLPRLRLPRQADSRLAAALAEAKEDQQDRRVLGKQTRWRQVMRHICATLASMRCRCSAAGRKGATAFQSQKTRDHLCSSSDSVAPSRVRIRKWRDARFKSPEISSCKSQ